MDDQSGQTSESGVVSLPDAAWSEARRRAVIIAPLAKMGVVTSRAAKKAAVELGVSDRTIYALVNKWRQSGGSLLQLVANPTNRKKPRKRLHLEIEQIIQDAIEKRYLTAQKPKISTLMQAVRRECRLLGLKPPALNTVRQRIGMLEAIAKAKAREGQDALRQLKPAYETSLDANAPMDVVQIDHTKVDLIIVDPHSRQPIGRPYLTVGIDIFSRCIVGMVVTLEAPSATSTGLCLAHMATDKSEYLKRLGIEVNWSMSGKPKEIHLDNAAEFHCEALRRGCEVHGIKIEHRPKGQPQYGGIVERVIGTAMSMIHELPGTTFSNISERGAYNSDANATLTLQELEKWLALAIAGQYHNSVHRTLMEPPAARWKQGLDSFGSPPKVSNEKAFLIDFLPIVRRKIQRVGFTVDHITYFSNSLIRWISERKILEAFVIRRDPRNLSSIWMLDPDRNVYLEIPYRTLTNPAITLWEHRKAIDVIRERGRDAVDEQAIFSAVTQMHDIAEQAAIKKRSARRNKVRRKHLASVSIPKKLQVPQNDQAENVVVAKPFGEIEEW